MGRIEPFADGTKVLHVGPPKTATTSIQSSFHASRQALAEHSVVYAGKTRHARSAATAIAMANPGSEFSQSAIEAWHVLAQEIRESQARITVLSSEGLSYANGARARKIVDSVGGTASVVITMRPPARMVPSVWQQRVRRGSDQPLDEWIDHVFERDARGALTATQFWARYGLDHLIATWSDVVGAENVGVVVLDPGDHALAFHAFEDLVGVPRGTLDQDVGLANESFPYAELETIRQFNRLFYEAGGSQKQRLSSVRGHYAEFRKPGAPRLDGPKADVPRWVAEQANEIATGWIESLGSFAGRLIGDPSHLLVDPSRYPERTEVPTVAPVASAAVLAHVMSLAGQQRARAAQSGTVAQPASPNNPGARRRLAAAWSALRGR